jgi:exonuclease SbcC
MKNPKVKELLKMTNEISDLEHKINKFDLNKSIENRKKEYDLNNKVLYEKYIEKNKKEEEIMKLKDEISDNEKCIKYIDYEIKIEIENNKWENETIIKEKEDCEKDKNELMVKMDNKKILEHELKKLINIQDLMNKNENIKSENEMIENEIEILKEDIKKLKDKKYEQYEEYLKEENRNNEILNKINELNNDYKELSKKLFKEQTTLNDLKDKEYEVANSSIIGDKNVMIIAKIDLLKEELKECDKEYHRLEIEKYKIEKDNEDIKNKVYNYESKKEEYIDVVQKKEIYEYYVELVHKNGLSLSIINKYLSYISDGVNKIIEPFLNKSIELNIDGSNIILNINVKDEIGKEQSVLMLGGRESFIFDTAFKIVLSKISEMPRSNFLFIDEGLSVFDKENLTNIKELLDYLNTFFDHVFLMSHIDIIKDMVENKIYIKKEGIYSVVCE